MYPAGGAVEWTVLINVHVRDVTIPFTHAGGGYAGEGYRDFPVPAGQGRVRKLLQDAFVEEAARGQER